MMSIIFVSTFVLGLLVGSFLNVVILRYNTGHSIVHGRSACLSCQSGLQWYELIPIVSFVVLRGRCRSCSVRLRMQYPLTEIATGVLFLIIAQQIAMLGVSLLSAVAMAVFYFTIVSLLVVIFVYDLYHKIIPNGIVYTFIALSFVQLFVGIVETHLAFVSPSLGALLAGPLLFTPFFLLWWVSKGTWMGFGDGKLAIGIGWMLGIVFGLSAIVLSFWIGAVVSVGLLMIQKITAGGRLTFKSEIPFAPFMIIGFLLVLLYKWDVIMIGGLLANYFM